MMGHAGKALLDVGTVEKCFSVQNIVTSSAQANTGVKPVMIMGGWYDWESQRGARRRRG